MHSAFWLENSLRATAACFFSASELQTVAQAPHVFSIFDLHALRTTAACNFWTCELQKVARAPACFWLENAHFDLERGSRHSCVPFFGKKRPDHVIFLAFWLEHVLLATAACYFWALCWRATSAPAALASLLFEHAEPRTIENNTAVRDFPNMTALHCFSTVHIVVRLLKFLRLYQPDKKTGKKNERTGNSGIWPLYHGSVEDQHWSDAAISYQHWATIHLFSIARQAPQRPCRCSTHRPHPVAWRRAHAPYLRYRKRVGCDKELGPRGWDMITIDKSMINNDHGDD